MVGKKRRFGDGNRFRANGFIGYYFAFGIYRPFVVGTAGNPAGKAASRQSCDAGKGIVYIIGNCDRVFG